MALYKQIQCAICLCDFTDPVSLPCKHSFCRLCILGHLQACNGQSSCPECRQQFTKDDLQPSPLLRNVIEAIQGHSKEKQNRANLNTSGLVCAEHDERLRLFCETDQTLVRMICRDGTKHQGHQFKPISSQFEELHQFLRKKEEEIRRYGYGGEKIDEDILKSALNLNQPEMFLKICYTNFKKEALILKNLVEFPNTLFTVYYSCPPVAECFTISPRTPLIVSPDGLSVRRRDIDLDDHEDIYSNETVSAEETFTTGQHCWELEVGQKPDWTVGVEKRMEGSDLLARLTGWKRCISEVASDHGTTLEFTELLRETHSFTNVCRSSLQA
uniref:RING-type domain-containing protein n=1 Tax=Pygocentrus nattereri TaxID=42514 RepID=A0A3B4CVS3_PYGNA